jgi:hypothetical protein
MFSKACIMIPWRCWTCIEYQMDFRCAGIFHTGNKPELTLISNFFRKYVYRLRVAKNREIYENCKMLPSMPCFAERHHAWTLPPPFDIRKANEACQKFHGLNNMASFYKFPRRLQLEATYKEKITDRYINLAQVTRGKLL